MSAPHCKGSGIAPRSAINEPRFRDDLPILLGGGGEKKTFGLAARYARHLNIICAPAELPRKLVALDERCVEAGRDRASIETSAYALLVVDEDGDRARALQHDYLRGTGVDLDSLDAEQRAAVTAMQFVGTPDDVAADLQARLLDTGVDGLIVSLPANGHEPGAVALVGDTLRKLDSLTAVCDSRAVEVPAPLHPSERGVRSDRTERTPRSLTWPRSRGIACSREITAGAPFDLRARALLFISRINLASRPR